MEVWNESNFKITRNQLSRTFFQLKRHFTLTFVNILEIPLNFCTGIIGNKALIVGNLVDFWNIVKNVAIYLKIRLAF